jgi:hypothetical protein
MCNAPLVPYVKVRGGPEILQCGYECGYWRAPQKSDHEGIAYTQKKENIFPIGAHGT